MAALHSSRRGFSLIEIVVAIGVIGAALVATGALVRIFPLGQATRDEKLALSIATNEIETLRADGYSGVPASGSFSNSELGALASSTGTIAVSSYNASTKEVQVTVSWQEAGGKSRSVSLTTLLTSGGGLP